MLTVSGVRKLSYVGAFFFIAVALGMPDRAYAVQTVSPAAAAQQEFQKRLQAYLKLRTDLAKKLAPLSPTADSAKLTAQQDSLAAAIRQVRATARQGDLVPELVAQQIRQSVQSDMRRRPAAEKRALLEDVPSGVRPVINRTYPTEAALPTVPALLLTALPRLPDNLQYRFFDRHLLIVDGDVNIIVDYITDVMPAR
jgi:hypothetical protein